MNPLFSKTSRAALALASLLMVCAFGAQAAIPGLTGGSFTLTAKQGHIATGDGYSIQCWGYANGAGLMQYPGPTLKVTQNAMVMITLNNELSEPVSIVFPGQANVTATGGVPGLLTREAPPGGSVTYMFTAARPGSYLYHSGTRMDLQVEMGLFGALIVYPSMGTNYAYNHADAQFDNEFLFLMSEIDIWPHDFVEFNQMEKIDTSTFFPVYYFLNGRNAPDTMIADFVPWLPTQPYMCMPMMHPGQRILLRMIGGGRDSHPFHTHGNNFTIIARDGELLQSAPGQGADRAESAFSAPVAPGQTYDAIFEWTGAKLGWDMYGHAQDRDEPPLGNFPGPEDVDHNGNGVFDNVMMEMAEYEPDHGKPFPVDLPGPAELTFGEMYSGSPFLGAAGFLPPGQGGFNPNAGFVYMWHSHTEKELTNYDIFPGGMMTHLMIEPHMMP